MLESCNVVKGKHVVGFGGREPVNPLTQIPTTS